MIGNIGLAQVALMFLVLAVVVVGFVWLVAFGVRLGCRSRS